MGIPRRLGERVGVPEQASEGAGHGEWERDTQKAKGQDSKREAHSVPLSQSTWSGLGCPDQVDTGHVSAE